MEKVEGFTKDNLVIRVFETRKDLGSAAAIQVAQKIGELLTAGKAQVNIIFAAAPSQNEFLEALVNESVDWSKVNAFHMDEYIGLDPEAPQGFGNFLRQKIFDRVDFRKVYYLDGNATDFTKEIERYTGLLDKYRADIVCMGIGENTHIAFNDPHVADFDDPQLVKVVDLDLVSRMQQVNDGCFTSIDEVPTHALTLTIPALLNADFIFCIVPSALKAAAVRHTLHEPVSEAFPSTILRKHPQTVLYLDQASAKLLKNE
ncbi:glucosamine-6-phosphate deaminase [Niabella terrae]